MKIRCDVCDKAEASVFCCADEAALCHGCDHQIHRANKLAGKHQRFSLLHPTSKDCPICDICQERRALLFCREDRAIICRDCDVSIHKANEHTQNHSRFLLTGVKLGFTQNPTKSTSSLEPLNSVFSEISKSASMGRSKGTLNSGFDDRNLSEPSSVSTSSLSEYLMETIPGWQFEDFCDPPPSVHNSLCKNVDPFISNLSQEFSSNSSFTSEDLSFWVPQVPIQPQFLHQSGMVDEVKMANEANTGKPCRRWNLDGFTVPEVSPVLHKKPRNF